MDTRDRWIVSLLAASLLLLAAGPAHSQTTELDLYDTAALQEAEPMEESDQESTDEADILGLIEESINGVAAVRYQVPSADGGEPDTGFASGFLLSADGYLVTAIPAEAVAITVIAGEEQTLEAELVGTDPLLGIGLLKLKGENPLEPVPIGSAFEVTEQQVAVSLQRARGTGATVGYIAGITAAAGGAVHLVASAALPPGSQGGPLLDLDGRVIGVIVSTPDDETRAIPVDLLRPVLDQLKAGEPVRRGSLGVDIQALDNALARSYGVPVDGGVVVGQVDTDGPADGILRPGDLIRRLAGAQVDDPTDIAMIVGSTTPGTALKVDIQRAGSEKTVTVHVGKRSERTAGAEAQTGSSGPQLEAELAAMTPEKAEQMGRAQQQGVLIAELPDDSPAAGALAEGDIIIDIAGISVGSPEEVQTALARQPADKPVRLVVSREGRVMVVAVELEAR